MREGTKSRDGVCFPETAYGTRTRGLDQVQGLEFLIKRAFSNPKASSGLFDVLIFAGERRRDVEALHFLQSPVGLVGVRTMFGTRFESEIAGFESWAVGEKERAFQNVAKLAN